MVIKLSAVTVLLEDGTSVSTSPAADPVKATVIVPIDAAAALLTVMVASALPIEASSTVTTLTIVPENGIGTYTVEAEDNPLRKVQQEIL